MKEIRLVPLDLSIELKSLGFDDPCITWYWDDIGIYKGFELGNHNKNPNLISAPLFYQAFNFFKSKYKLYPNITQYYGERFYFKIDDMVHPRRFDEYPVELIRDFGEYSSEEEAELACLKKLIEICLKK